MKVTRLICLSTMLVGLMTQLFAQSQPNVQFDPDEVICKEQQHAMSMSAMTHSRNAAAEETDIYYQVNRWEIDPAVYFIKGEITYCFKSLKEGLSQFVLDLSDAHTVKQVMWNGHQLGFTHLSDQLLTIDLGKSLHLGEQDTVTVTYEGMPPSNGFGSFEQSTHNNAPIIWTLSEPYGCRDWWPAKQDLIDKVDSMDTYITTPYGNLAASNGILVSIEDTGEKLIHHWKHRHPIAAYLVALAVTNYAAYSDYLPLANGDTIEILNYVYPENLDNVKQQTVAAIDIMGLYNELFGTYPFADEKYGHAQFGWGGGMEHQTMSFMVSFSYGLIAHEMAHQWFGDKVTCGSWADIWLNEGFATYLTGLTYERFSPNQYWPQWRSSTINSVTSQPGGSVFVTDTSDVNRIFSNRLTYNKGAYLLHMLRWVTGDSAFFGACRDYLNSPGTAYDFGRTSELQHYLEMHSGKDLDEFFKDWYYGQGFPSYHIQWSSAQDSVHFIISQQTSNPSVDFFEMPLPLAVYHDGTRDIFVANHTGQNQAFSFYTGQMNIDSVKFDPDLWILSKNNIVEQMVVGNADDQLSNFNYRAFPNPATSVITVVAPDETTAELVDITGKKITLTGHDHRYDVSGFSSGAYLLRMLDHEGKVQWTTSITIVR